MSAVADAQTDSSKTVALDDTTILVSRTPLVTTGDITSANASQAGDRWAVNFAVTDAAAKRVHDFTEAHVGNSLAIVVNGKTQDTPRIASALTGNRFRIDGLDRASAERLASAVNNGCRR